MACRYTYQGKTYEAHEFDDVLRAMKPAEASKFMPSVESIPEAPMIGKTDAWVSLALKRVIKMASDEGYDKVAFINGEQSAVRYSLDKQVDSIQYRKAGADAYEMSIIARGGGAIESIPKPVNGKFYTTAEVEEIIGKEMVSKMDAEEGKSIASGPWRKLEGDDLKLEAKGMRAFYDKIVPSVAKDVLRKLGGGQMETVNLRGSESKDALAQTGFTITDKMKEHASKGMPMFARGQGNSGQQLPRLANQSTANALNAVLAKYFKGDDYVYRSVGWGQGSAESDVRQAFRDAFGSRIEFVQSDTGGPLLFNGFNIPEQPNTLFVNVDGNVNFLSIGGHELWHAIKRQRPDLIEWYRENSRQYYKDLPAYRDRLNNLLQPGESAYTDAKAQEELEADFLGDSLTDPEFLQQLADASPSKFKALMTHVRLWLSKVLNKLKGLGSTKEVNDVKALQGYLKEVLVAFADGKAIPAAPAEIAFARTENGESGIVTMKEIEALNDTPTVAIMKEAVDAIGETEFQRRVKKKTEKVTANGKFQASESMLVEATAREVVAISRRNGDFDGGKADIRFSRTAISTAANRVADKLNETFSHPGKLNWWHKSFGTMNNLAERSPAFKPVFNAAQNFINDVSYYATEAADLAPKMLPKLDKWSDLFKSPITAADNKAISAPIFEGTLSWARDEQGKPVRMDDLEATYAKLSDEEKAQMLLKKRFVTEGELKRWKASPLDIYEGAVRNRFKTNFLTPGVVWKDAELVSLFKLTPEQISLYREFLAATDKSLDNLAKADMLRFGGKDVAHLQDMVMDAKDADEAAVMLRDYLHSLRDLMPEKVDELNNTASGMIERADKVNKLKAQGYAPLSRFGKYTVDVVVDGERQFFSLFETVRDANKMAAKMKMEYGAANVAQGTLSESEFKLFAGITPESLELFGNMLGLDSTGDAARDKAFQTYLKLTKTNRSAMRRMIHRKGIAGFSEDAGRVLAAFVYSNARQTSAALHMSGMGDAINDIPKSQGELKDAAIALADYIKSPQEEAQAIRGLLFAQYLGGSVASAFVNMMQPFAVTFPWLSQYGGAKQSGEQLLRAMKDMATKGFVYEPELAKALHKAEELGIVSPQEVHQLMAQARGASSLKPGDGTRTGDAMAKASNALSRLSFGWGQVFGMAEQLNRRSTFIAAYRVAKAQGMKNPADFAKKAVNDTQFIYNRGNKMRFGRGAVGATLMTFKTFSIAYMELLSRMYSQGGPEGKKAVLLALGVMLLMGGAGGLPFAEDAEDLVDGMLQRLGYNVSIKKAKQEFLENLFGKAGADFVERGVSGLPGMPLDVSGRLGMGNLVPGTGLFKSKSSHARDLGELAGPAGDFGRRLFEAGGQVLGGDVVKAALTASPVAVRNAAKGLDMAGTGMYRDDKGYKVLDTSLLEAAFKSIGFQPATVAKVQEANFINQQAKNFYSQTAADIRARWAKGIFEKDPGQIEAARDMIRIWNEKNPDQPIRPNMPAILKRVREMSKSKDQRIADTAPKAMRVQMRLDMAERRAVQE